MNTFQLTGGARIGKYNATYPLAILKVEKDFLELNANIAGNLIFSKDDILSIEPYTLIPFIGQGIKIVHKVSNYNEKVIFWTTKDPTFLVKKIKNTGFLNQDNTPHPSVINHINERQKQGGFPLKKPFIIIMIVLWNVLILSSFLIPFLLKESNFFIFHGILAALGMVFSVSFLSLISSSFRSLILKNGRNLNDIKRFSFFMLLISGIMLIAFSGITFIQ